MIGTQEIILIIIAALLIFGAKRIPDIARSLGEGIKEFKKAMNPDTDAKVHDTYPLKQKNIKHYNARKKRKTSQKRK